MYKKCCAIKLCFSRELIQVLMSLYMSTKSINRQSCFGVLWNVTCHTSQPFCKSIFQELLNQLIPEPAAHFYAVSPVDLKTRE